MIPNREKYFKSMPKEFKSELLKIFSDKNTKVWAIGVIPRESNKVDIRAYLNLCEISRFNDDIMIFSGETNWLD